MYCDSLGIIFNKTLDSKMHKTVEEIIDRLIGAVKADKPYYMLKDLHAAGFPSFIVERIRIELGGNLKEEFALNESKWVDIEHPQVSKAWNDFQRTLFKNARIPKDRFYEITSRVMGEIVQVYLEPRQYMADYIYRSDEELDYNELVNRTNKLTIYKHFARAIPMYMNKRKLKSMEKERCMRLIHNLDTSLVASYSVEDWAQVLDLLFKLFGGRVDPKLLEVFFGAKGLYLTAKQFTPLKEEVSKEQFNQILSDPAILDPNKQEQHREDYLKGHSEQQKAQGETVNPKEQLDEKEQQLFASFFSDNKENYEQVENEASFNALFKPKKPDKSIADEYEGEKDKDASSDKDAFRENLASVLNQAASSYNSLSSEGDEEPKEDEPPVLGSDTEKPKENTLDDLVADETDEDLIQDEEEIDEDENAEGGGAVWEQYLSPDQMDLLMGTKKNTDDEHVLMDDLVAEDDESIPELKEYLIGQEGIFVKDIFKGKKKKYNEALKKIQDFTDWEKASHYIQKNVFSANKIDMFSDVAVDLTDQLQSYFEEYKS